MNTTSPTLLNAIRDGGTPADWATFVALYAPMLDRWGQRMGLDHAQREDLVQEVLLAVVRHVRDFRRERKGSFRKWLQTIALRVVLQEQRRFSRPAQADPTQTPLEEVPDRSRLPQLWDELDARDLSRRVLQVLKANYKETTWQAFWQHIVLDRPADEVAAALRLSRNAVWVYSSRVLQRLRGQFGDLLE